MRKLFNIGGISKDKSKFKKLKKESYLVNQNALSLWSKEGVWFFSLKKSGTTYTLNVILNYICALTSDKKQKVDYETLMFFHSSHVVLKKNGIEQILRSQLKLLESTPYESIISTHDNMIAPLSKKNIILIRNPLDWFVSTYHWNIKNRSKNVRKESESRVWKKLCDEFIVVYKDQKNLLKNEPEKTQRFYYEDLMSDAELTFSQIVQHLELPLDEGLLRWAIDQSSMENIKTEEQILGRALVASENFKGTSFIRSGKVGEWQDVLSLDLVNRIQDYLVENGVDLNRFRYTL